MSLLKIALSFSSSFCACTLISLRMSSLMNCTLNVVLFHLQILQCLSISGLTSSGGGGSTGGGDAGSSSGASRAIVKER